MVLFASLILMYKEIQISSLASGLTKSYSSIVDINFVSLFQLLCIPCKWSKYCLNGLGLELFDMSMKHCFKIMLADGNPKFQLSTYGLVNLTSFWLKNFDYMLYALPIPYLALSLPCFHMSKPILHSQIHCKYNIDMLQIPLSCIKGH